jgi:predicted DCC family thiol-disulfide oxidoreductase YuxK
MSDSSVASNKKNSSGILDKLFGIDIRSLALVRILIALIALIDLATRASSLRVFYGNEGVLPSIVSNTFWNGDWSWSLHLWGGGPFFLVATLFAIHALAALALLIGYRTRLATFVTWFLFASLDNANPLVLYGGDVLLLATLFVAMFLPWGEAYSLDAALSRRMLAPRRILSGWTAAFLLQLAFMYFFTAQMKIGPEWQDGSAIYYALASGTFTSHFGEYLMHFPHLLSFLTNIVLVLEYLVIFLLFCPVYTNALRFVTLALLIPMHVAFALSLNIGLFSWITIAALMAFIPSEAWDAVRNFARKRFGGVTIYYDGECGFCKNTAWVLYIFLALPESAVTTAQENESVLADMRQRDSWVLVARDGSRHFEFDAVAEIFGASPIFFFVAPLLRTSLISRIGKRCYRFVATHRPRVCIPDVETPPLHHSRILSFAGTALGLCYILYIFLWQAAASPVLMRFFPFPNNFIFVAQALEIGQYWDMFSQSPLGSVEWMVVPGTLEDGREVDLFRGGAPLTFEKPPRLADLYSDIRSRKYTQSLWSDTNAFYRQYYARYLCSQWNSTHGRSDHLQTLSMILLFEPETPQGAPIPAVQRFPLLNTWKCQ